MKKKLLFVFASISIISVDCSKNDKPVHPIDPDSHSITGKWVFESSTGMPINDDALTYPVMDTLIFQDDNLYFIIKNNDTIDKGTFTLGHGQAINGFGKTQAFDSILYKTNSISEVMTGRLYPYYQIESDTLSLSSEYFKDSSKNKAFLSYIRL